MSLLTDVRDLATSKISPDEFTRKAAKDLSAFANLGTALLNWALVALEAFLTREFNSTWAGLIMDGIRADLGVSTPVIPTPPPPPPSGATNATTGS